MAPIIDCDMHPAANSIQDFLPFVREEGWRKRFSSKEFTLSGRAMERYYHPGGGTLREDTKPPEGGIPGSDPAFSRTDYLDPFEVEMALMLPIQGAAIGAWTDPVAATVFAVACNDYFVEKWASVDSRYRLAAVVSPLDPLAAAEEVRRHKDDPRVIAVFLPLINTLMGNRHYYPIYEAASECGMPVVIHPTGSEGCYLGTPVLAGGVPRSYAERRVLLPQVGQSSVNSMVFEGVFERYPDLKLVVNEYGFSWALPLLWRMDKEWTSFRYDVPWMKSSPSEYVIEHVRFTTQPIDEPPVAKQLWQLMESMSAERTLLFSSDYPHWDTDPPELILKRLPEKLRAPLARDNALELFSARL
jgi:uncharacterized protein